MYDNEVWGVCGIVYGSLIIPLVISVLMRGGKIGFDQKKWSFYSCCWLLGFVVFGFMYFADIYPVAALFFASVVFVGCFFVFFYFKKAIAFVVALWVGCSVGYKKWVYWSVLWIVIMFLYEYIFVSSDYGSYLSYVSDKGLEAYALMFLPPIISIIARGVYKKIIW